MWIKKLTKSSKCLSVVFLLPHTIFYLNVYQFWYLIHWILILQLSFVCATSCSLLHWPAQHLRSRCDVSILRPGCHWPSHAEVPVVEETPYVTAAGECCSVWNKLWMCVCEERWFELFPSCLSRCSFWCSSCTRAATCSQSATSPNPWTC